MAALFQKFMRVNSSGVEVTSDAPALGQAAAAASMPVVIASDQSAVPVTGLPAALGQMAAAESTSVVLAKGSALTDRSGALAAGATAENAMAANTSRRYLYIENPITATERLWFSPNTTAVADSPSISLEPGQSFVYEGSFVPTGAVSVISATLGHKWTAREA